MTLVAEDKVLQDFPDCVIGWQIGKLHRMAKRKVYKTTTVARAKAASSKARSARSGKKRASREAELRPKQVLSVRLVVPARKRIVSSALACPVQRRIETAG